MTEVTPGVWGPSSSDAELITAVRCGDTVAFGHLYERHGSAARTVARQYTNSAADAEDVVSEAFSKVFVALQSGGGPDVAFRAYLFTVVRRVAISGLDRGRRVQPTDDMGAFEAAFGSTGSVEEPTLEGFERGVVASAYRSLPERWQAVLWYTEVERLSPAEIAPLLGLTANGVAALSYRAREGLRQAYLQQHLSNLPSEACESASSKLGSYVRGGLAKRETRAVEEHLETCGDCRALVLELSDVNHGMRMVIAPLVLGAAGLGALDVGLGIGSAAASTGTAAGAATGTGGSTGSAGGSGASAGGATGGTGASSGAGAAGGASGTGAGGAAGAGGSTVGAGAGVGAGATGAAGGAAGAGAVGAAGASAAGAAGGVSAGAVGVGAAAGAAGAVAGATGAVAGATGAIAGVAGLVASLPVIGLAVGSVVAVGAVAAVTAGVLGVFSDDPAEPPAAAAGEESPQGEPGDRAAAELPGDRGAPPDDPANIPQPEPEPEEPGAPLATAPEVTTDRPGATGAGTASAPRTVDDPPEPPPAPPRVVVGDLPEIQLTSGAHQRVEIPVANTGGQAASVVRTDLIFAEGVRWDVQVAPPVTGGGGGGRLGTASGASGWTCRPADATTAACELKELRPGASSTLAVLISIEDATLDGQTVVGVGVRTWLPGRTATPPPPRSVPVRMSSPPAALSVGEVHVAALVGGHPQTVAVPVRNTGGTTARGVTATVQLPEDVAWAPGDGRWTCADGPAARTVRCEIGTLARGATEPIRLALTPDPALRNVDRPAHIAVDVRAGALTAPSTTVPVRVRSAPAQLELDVRPLDPILPGRPGTAELTVRNVGGTDAHRAQVQVELPRYTVAPEGDGWTRCADLLCAEVTVPADGERTLRLTVQAPESLRNVDTMSTLVAQVGAGDGAARVSQGVRVASAPARLVLDVQVDADRVEPGHPAPATVTVRNVGGTDAIGAQVQVRLPDHVVITDPGGVGWTTCDSGRSVCATVTAGSDPATPVHLPLTLQAPDSLRDVHVDGRLTASAPGVAGSTAGEDSVVVVSAPARLGVELGAVDALVDGAEPRTATVTVRNTGGTTARDAEVRLILPEHVRLTGAAASAWTACGGVLCREVTVPAPAPDATSRTVSVDITLAADVGYDVEATETIRVEVHEASAQRPVEVRSAPARLAVAADGDVVLRPHRSGTVELSVHNTGGFTARDVTAAVVIPDGFAWDDAASPAGWRCEVHGSGATCDLDGTLAPGGGAVDLDVPVVARTAGAAPGAVTVTVSARSVDGAVDAVSAAGQVDVDPYRSIEVEVIGRTGQASCGFSGDCTWTSGGRTLTLPAGARVEAARVYWTAGVPGSGHGDVVHLTSGGHSVEVRSGATITEFSGIRSSYLAVRDVTDLVRQAGSGTYQLSGIPARSGSTVGWRLVVAYSLPDIDDERRADDVVRFVGHPQWILLGSYRTTVEAEAGSTVQLTALRWGTSLLGLDSFWLDGAFLDGRAAAENTLVFAPEVVSRANPEFTSVGIGSVYVLGPLAAVVTPAG